MHTFCSLKLPIPTTLRRQRSHPNYILPIKELEKTIGFNCAYGQWTKWPIQQEGTLAARKLISSLDK